MSDENISNSKPVEAQPAASSSRAGLSSNIATFSSLREESNADPGQQAFYAGGSTTSGQQVLGPAVPTGNTDQFVKEMFKQARQNAVVQEPKEKKSSTFSGSGFTLGSTANESVRIGRVKHDNEESSDEEDSQTVLRLWRNGFSIDDGELRSYQNPENLQFLASVRRGEVPKELMVGRRHDLTLRMEDNRSTDYEPQKTKKITAFKGQGNRLGSPSSDVIETSVVPLPVAANPEKYLDQANAFLALNQSEPNTRVQIRLSDGSR